MPHREQFALADLHTWGTVLDYNSRIQDEGYAWPRNDLPNGLVGSQANDITPLVCTS